MPASTSENTQYKPLVQQQIPHQLNFEEKRATKALHGAIIVFTLFILKFTLASKMYSK